MLDQEALIKETTGLGKLAWRRCCATPPNCTGAAPTRRAPLSLIHWEEIGPGYCYGPAFGHWDLIHQILDVMPAEPEHARNQILNDLAAQEEIRTGAGQHLYERGRLALEP